MIAANARGKAVQSTTSAKISQTLLASQTGAIDVVDERARPGPASRAARRQIPEARAVVGAAEHGVAGDA